MRMRLCCSVWWVLAALAAAAGELPWRQTLGRAEELRQQHRFPEAERVLTVALADAQRVSPSDPGIGVALNNLGFIYHAQGKYLEAEKSYQRSLLAFERALGPDHQHLARTILLNLAELYLDTGNDGKAERLLNRALAILRQGASDPGALASAEGDLAALYVRHGQFEAARPLLDDALALCMEKLGTEDPRTATALNNLAAWAFMTGRRDEAAGYSRRALAILEPQASRQPTELARVLGNLGLFSSGAGATEEAEAYLVRAVAIAEPALGAGHPLLAPILRTYAGVLRRLHRKREAKAVEQRAGRIQAGNARDNALGLTVDVQSLLASNPATAPAP